MLLQNYALLPVSYSIGYNMRLVSESSFVFLKLEPPLSRLFISLGSYPRVHKPWWAAVLL